MMSFSADFNTNSNVETEREHVVQLGLLRALCKAAGENRDAGSVAEILDQLIAFSEVHFASEELLMRLKSYDDYEDHVEDHAQMMDTLRSIAANHAEGDPSLIAGRAAELLGFIGNHIATRDSRFADYVRNNL